MGDQDLEKKIQDYSQLAKENPNVDVSLLMMSALKNENEKLTTAKSRKWPYIISLSVPPLGLLYAAKFYLSGDSDDRSAGNMCVILTVVSIVAFLIFGKVLISSSGTTPQQIEQITPQDIHNTLQ